MDGRYEADFSSLLLPGFLLMKEALSCGRHNQRTITEVGRSIRTSPWVSFQVHFYKKYTPQPLQKYEPAKYGVILVVPHIKNYAHKLNENK
jgi:hypothetical protein